MTCVTSVDYEHVELLGHSLELIVSDKSDACAAGGSIVYGENCRGLRPHILEYNRHREVTSLFVRDQIGIGGEAVSASGQRFDFSFGDHEFRSLESALLGAFQFNNAAIAVTLFLLWLRRRGRKIVRAQSKPRCDRACATRAGPAGSKSSAQDPLTVIDVGHTPDGIRQSLASLKQAPRRAGRGFWWSAFPPTRRSDEIVGALAPSFDTIICTAAHHKGADAAALAAVVRAGQSAGRVSTSPRRSRMRSASARHLRHRATGRYMSPADCSPRSNTPTVARGGRAEDLKFF